MSAPLQGKTLFISGASRGIGLAIALRAARDGANVALIAKTAEPHPKLEGTVYTAAQEIEAAGGQALPIVGDIREEEQVEAAVEQAVERFGGIDVCVNNASAINLVGHRGPAGQALRPDAVDQRARHVRRVARLHPAPAQGRATRTSSRCRRRSRWSRSGCGATSATPWPSTA